jgi:hypothetical protein
MGLDKLFIFSGGAYVESKAISKTSNYNLFRRGNSGTNRACKYMWFDFPT